MRSEGQALALEQLEQIAAQSDGLLELVHIRDPAADGDPLVIDVSVDCRGYDHRDGGLQLRHRERLKISASSLFPLEPPQLDFADRRYAGAPHVQWGSHICLYQAPQTEWQPDDGMFGLMQRVNDWLGAAAAGELDPVGLPLHPPVAYAGGGPIIIPTMDTPAVDPSWWAGYATIEREEERWVELGRWIKYDGDVPAVRLAPAILLSNDMPFEYPQTVAGLAQVLADRSISISVIQTLVTLGVLRASPGEAVYVVLGAAMRGVSGEVRRQHLACWMLDAARADKLREAALGPENDDRKRSFFEAWAATATMDWLKVQEERPEIVTARDAGSVAAWWRGRRVTILGCGAIGSALAMLLGRAGVAEMQLYDNGRVTPGLLVRQLFDRKQLGQPKASATRFNVRYANPRVEVEASGRDVVRLVQEEAGLEALLDADVIIDATATRTVALALEKRLAGKIGARPALISMSLGHTAEHAILTCSAPGAAGAGQDLDRRTKLSLARAPDGRLFLDEFWPTTVDRARLFQPEPGCSDPTFRGSATDVLMLTGAMLNRATRWLAAPKQHLAVVMRAPASAPVPRQRDVLEFAWPNEVVIRDWVRGYEVRIDATARGALSGWMRRSERLRGPGVETGGVLFGEVNQFLGVIWISEVSGPPPDSRASAAGFICGVKGVQELNAEKRARTRGSVQFIGMWHTHPGAEPDPSETDRSAMRSLLSQPSFQGRTFLMLIVGGSSRAPIIAGGLYARADV